MRTEFTAMMQAIEDSAPPPAPTTLVLTIGQRHEPELFNDCLRKKVNRPFPKSSLLYTVMIASAMSAHALERRKHRAPFYHRSKAPIESTFDQPLSKAKLKKQAKGKKPRSKR
jgi:hypothetical protein